MEQNNKGMRTGWDAREEYNKELMYRIHLVLNSDYRNPEQWFENLNDAFDFAQSGINAFKERYCDSCSKKLDMYDKQLDDIMKLLHTKKELGKILTIKNKKINQELAYRKMRYFTRNLLRDLMEGGWLVPIKESYDVVEGFRNQFK